MDDGRPGQEQRDESAAERLDRNFAELLQELRVAQTGVQILFAFLLTLAFTDRFGHLTTPQRAAYVVALLATALAAALLIAPVSYHRLLFRRHRKDELVRAAARFAVGGLFLVLVGVSAAVLLITDVVFGPIPAIIITALVVIWYGTFWYALPMWSLARERRSG